MASYPYVSNNNPAENLGNPSCLIFTEFTQNQISTRYTSKPTGCSISGDYTTVTQASLAYQNALNQYKLGNDYELANMIGNLTT